MDDALSLAAISWNPEIRNILSLLVGVGVLIGSVYLLLATNLGARLGMMIALAGLFGWMLIMGIVWWMYGIGMKGEAAHWSVIEINTADLSVAEFEKARELPEPSELPDPLEVLEEHPELTEVVIPPGQEGKIPTLGELVEADPSLADELNLDEQLGDWELLLPSNPQRGDAVATTDAALVAEEKFAGPSDYKLLDAFTTGGKDKLPENPDRLDRIWHKIETIIQWRHPPHHVVVQVVPVIPECQEGQEPTDDAPCVEVAPGEAPPPAQPLLGAEVISVIMIRDLGDLRFPAAMVTIVFGILFALTCWRLHEREKVVMAHRAAATG